MPIEGSVGSRSRNGLPEDAGQCVPLPLAGDMHRELAASSGVVGWYQRSRPRAAYLPGPALDPVPGVGSKRELPADLLFLLASVAALAALTVIVAHAIGVPLVLPTEKVSPALGVPSSLPLALALLGYGAGQIWQRSRAKVRGLDRSWRACVAVDLLFVTLFVVVTYFHFQLKMWLPLINPHLLDAFYFRIDVALRPLIDGLGVVQTGWPARCRSRTSGIRARRSACSSCPSGRTPSATGVGITTT